MGPKAGAQTAKTNLKWLFQPDLSQLDEFLTALHFAWRWPSFLHSLCSARLWASKGEERADLFLFNMKEESCIFSLGFLTQKNNALCLWWETFLWLENSQWGLERSKLCPSLPEPWSSRKRSLDGARHLLGISRTLFIFLSHTSAAHGYNKHGWGAESISHQ